MELMPTVQPTAMPVIVPAPAAPLISMLMMQHANLIQPNIATAPVVRVVTAATLLTATAPLTVVNIIAAAGSALPRKQIVNKYAGAKTACVKVPRIIALINAPPTNATRLMVFVTIRPNPTVQRIAASWASPKEGSLIFLMTITAALLTPTMPQVWASESATCAITIVQVMRAALVIPPAVIRLLT
jgi:hypothetical protein